LNHYLYTLFTPAGQLRADHELERVLDI